MDPNELTYRVQQVGWLEQEIADLKSGAGMGPHKYGTVRQWAEGLLAYWLDNMKAEDALPTWFGEHDRAWIMEHLMKGTYTEFQQTILDEEGYAIFKSGGWYRTDFNVEDQCVDLVSGPEYLPAETTIKYHLDRLDNLVETMKRIAPLEEWQLFEDWYEK